MKRSYDPQSDYLTLSMPGRASVESEEVVPGLVVDFDSKGEIVGIEIEHASERFDPATLRAMISRPSRKEAHAAQPI
jgi:uncharacterized protein YuzE